MTAEELLEEGWVRIVLVILFFSIPLVVWVFASAQEAAAFERVTGKHVSTWDAMWIELRVQEGPAK